MVSVEQTANIGGGTIWPKAALDEVVQVAKAHGMATHMDGARLLNACVATGISARDMAAGWDSVWIDFTKGLGAPIGGGACRLARLHRPGLALEAAARRLAAPGRHLRRGLRLHALDHHVDRLADDHANARALARGLRQIQGLDVQQPETNLVFFKPDGAGVSGDDMIKALRQRGVLVSMLGGRVRACTHLDVSAGMVEETVALVREIVRGA